MFCGDITRSADVDFISSWLAKSGKVVDTLYVSNCHEYGDTTLKGITDYAESIVGLVSAAKPYVLTTSPRLNQKELFV